MRCGNDFPSEDGIAHQCENTARYDSGYCGVCDILVNEGRGRRKKMRDSWDHYFLEISEVVATRSTCPRVPDGVGAVLVSPRRRILSTGYAGSIPGGDHCDDVGCMIDEKTGGCVRTVHAETNAILQAASHGVTLEGSTCYSTMSPCWDCFKALLGGGVSRIVYSTEYRTVDRQKESAKFHGVEFTHLGDKKYVGGRVVDKRNFGVCDQCDQQGEIVERHSGKQSDGQDLDIEICRNCSEKNT